MEVREYTCKNGDYSFSIINLGCAVTSIRTPDREGKIANVTLPFVNAVEDPEAVLDSGCFFGYTVGRFANRIGGAGFTLNGKKYSFEANNGPNFLHSGKAGLWARLWNVRHTEDGFICSIKVSEQEDGFPGDADIRVRFSMSADGVFKIHYSVTCTEICPINLTNHTYFNLTGDPSNDILSHRAQIFCSRIVSVGPGLMPDGALTSVDSTAFDFRNEKTFGRDINAKELELAGGYDHAFVIDRPDNESRGFTRFARVFDEKSGRVLQAYTDLPAFHLYTGNYLDGSYAGYQKNHGFCLETEFYPDCVNHEDFPSCLVSPGELFESTTVYHFYTDKNSNTEN